MKTKTTIIIAIVLFLSSGLTSQTSDTSSNYTIGLWPELGGYVFWVSEDGKHGLVAETQNQGITSWYYAKDLISNPENHSSIGANFRDWRLPTKYELNEMYKQRGDIGGFDDYLFWSSTSFGIGLGNLFAWSETFSNGEQLYHLKSDYIHVRSVRDF